jgi:hypothetical protein
MEHWDFRFGGAEYGPTAGGDPWGDLGSLEDQVGPGLPDYARPAAMPQSDGRRLLVGLLSDSSEPPPFAAA